VVRGPQFEKRCLSVIIRPSNELAWWWLWGIETCSPEVVDYNKTSRLFQITNLMHNSFILQKYVCYTTILNMFRAAPCSSSGGQIVLLQPLVSSPSVNSRTVCRLRADCSVCTHASQVTNAAITLTTSCTALYVSTFNQVCNV